MTDIERAARRLGRPELAPVVDELARRLGERAATPTRVTLRGLSSDTRSALADLLGTAKLPLADATLDVARLASALGLADRDSVRGVIELLRGPLPSRDVERVAEARARQELWDWFTDRCRRLTVTGVGALRDWPIDVRRDGVRGTLDEHRARLAQALDVLEALAGVPTTGMPLAGFANRVLGDSHALDPSQPLARLVIAAIADAASQPRPTTAGEIRAIWELVRVAPDPLSSNVLTLGLALADDHPLAPAVRRHRDASEPLVLTLSQLHRWPIDPLSAGRSAFVVENPAVVAAAATRGWAGPPIVCSSGRPSVAVVTLLRQLGARGGPLQHHADFDVAGVEITAWLARHAGTNPWRMTSDQYLAAAATRQDRPRLRGLVPATPWDPLLTGAMQQAGVAVYEEELTDSLLDGMCSG